MIKKEWLWINDLNKNKMENNRRTIKLDTTNGHNKAIVDRFNAVAEQYSDYSMLEHILVKWADDSDLLDITQTLEDRLT
tara:strand:+ start:270 stop:506 length:237 start_codon:yes stop_codon:yes gene_type:complete